MVFKNRNMVLEMQTIANIIYGTGSSAGKCSANSIDSEQTPSFSTQSAVLEGPSYGADLEAAPHPTAGSSPF